MAGQTPAVSLCGQTAESAAVHPYAAAAATSNVKSDAGCIVGGTICVYSESRHFFPAYTTLQRSFPGFTAGAKILHIRPRWQDRFGVSGSTKTTPGDC